MTKVRVRNPGPAALLVINGRKNNMARRRTSRRRSVARRRSNPLHFRSRRRHVSRRRNPSLGGGLFKRGIIVAAGGMLTQTINGFIPAWGGSSPVADIGRTLASAWLAGFAVEKIGYGHYAQDVTLGGIAVVGAKLIGWAKGYIAPQLKAITGNGVSDVVTLPRGSYDSYFGSSPVVPVAGMGNVVTVPRFQNY